MAAIALAVAIRPKRVATARPRRPAREFVWEAGKTMNIAVVSDTHSEPHENALSIVRGLAPDLILHGGDIGKLNVLDELEKIATLVVVRGNIDPHGQGLADVEEIHIQQGERVALRILLTHIAVYGPRLRAEVRSLAQDCQTDLVVCGHSHVPFLGRDRNIGLFNPGSIGPRRPPLPICLGHIQLNEKGVHFRHIDCETGTDWTPPEMV